MSASARYVAQYLERFAEPEAHRRWPGVVARPRWGVAIPACGEGTALLDVLASFPSGAEALVVVVVNEGPDAGSEVTAANQACLAAVRARYGAVGRVVPAEPGWLLTLDRTGPASMPAKRGVGLARKIGVDVLLGLWARQELEGGAFGLTDADVRVPPTYFAGLATLAATAGAAAGWFPFVHAPRDTSEQPLQALACAYEVYLRHYTLGLAHAGSPYAFPTIGSTIAVDAEAYAKVRGVPSREAAEDFYLLNKLRKVGQVIPLGGEPLRLSPRLSSRVPFGTGAFLRQWKGASPDELPAYDPRVFDALRVCLESQSAAANDPPRLRYIIEEQARQAELPAPARAILTAPPLVDILNGALQRGRTPASRSRHLLDAFDGFRTLRLVHSLRDACYPNLPLREALRRSRFVPGPAQPMEAIRATLATQD